MEYSIYNEDCLKIMDKIEDKTAECIITDLPFNIVTSLGANRKKYSNQLRNLDKGDADKKTFDLHSFLSEVARISNGAIYLFCGYNQMSEIFNFFSEHKDFMVRVCYWKKTNPSPMNGQHMYLNAVEPIVFAKRRKTKFLANCSHNWFEFSQDKEFIDFMSNNTEVVTLPTKRGKIHPTEKPVELLQQFILDSTVAFDRVYDFCAGSMSTGVASLSLDRYFTGVELNKEFFTRGADRLYDYKNKMK